MSEPIQATYDELNEVATALQALAERAEQVEKDLNQARTDLSGEWVGFGADGFFDEMDNELVPSLGKLSAALLSAATTTTLISNQFLETETADAAAIKGSTGAQPGPTPNSPWGDAGTPASAMPPNSDQPQTEPFDPDHAKETYKDLYDLETMGELLKENPKIPGAGSEELNDLMETLQDHMYALSDAEIEAQLDEMFETYSPIDRESARQALIEQYQNSLSNAELNNVLTQIADLRGYEDPQAFVEQYQQMIANRPEKPPVAVNETLHPKFLGSMQNLQYGTIVGEILGIDPVLAAMLNPTGGLVGPGNASLPFAPDSVLNIHGAYHDASGYLYNYHDGLGKGYEYVGVDDYLDTGNPVAGQVSGIEYWLDKQSNPHPNPIWSYDNSNDTPWEYGKY